MMAWPNGKLVNSHVSMRVVHVSFEVKVQANIYSLEMDAQISQELWKGKVVGDVLIRGSGASPIFMLTEMLINCFL